MTETTDKPPVNTDAALNKLVADLPEIYQPIFGHPELSIRVSRKCEDRLKHITQIYQTLEAKLGRPLRVLDLGCAQGFFSLSLAKLGAAVFGVDFQSPNVTVCNALAAEHPDSDVRFQMGLVEDAIFRLEQDEYDLVLGLSVFHHLVHRVGIEDVQKMLAILADRTVAGIFEMALPTEPPDWANSQPQNPRELLNHYSFVHEFAQNSTHLSTINRPLYIASNRYWFLDDQAESFDSWTTEPHALANNAGMGTRRYYFGNGVLAKLFFLDTDDHREVNSCEHNNEVKFLNNLPTNFQTPTLRLYGQHEREAWLVREQLPGELLLDKIRFKTPYDATAVLRDVLEQLVRLEATGLYHIDVRTWNVLIEPNGHATLIDYGAISQNTNDCQWPRNLFLSFMIFVREVISNGTLLPDPIRPPSFNPEGFPEPYQSVFRKLFELPVNEWSFTLLRDLFIRAEKENSLHLAPIQHGYSLAFQTMEDACKILQESANNWRHRANLSEELAHRLQKVTITRSQSGGEK